LVDWIKSSRFKSVIILTSMFASERRDTQLTTYVLTYLLTLFTCLLTYVSAFCSVLVLVLVQIFYFVFVSRNGTDMLELALAILELLLVELVSSVLLRC